MTNNLSFIFTPGLSHFDPGDENTLGVTWTDNFYNSTVIGNAGATALPTNTYTMVTESGWRSLTPGTVTMSDFAIQ